MSRATGWSVLAVSIALCSAPWVHAAGVLVPRDGSAPIRVQSHRVTAIVEDGLARTTVRQSFVNPHGRVLEAVYLFPLPDGAALVDLALEVGGQRLEGLLAERKDARRVYDQLVGRNQDPALVEQIGRSKFRLSVFPVVPDKPTVVELSYVESVPLLAGEHRYVYPLAVEDGASDTEQDLTATVVVRSAASIRAIESPTPGMATSVVSEHEGRASLEVAKGRLDRDLVVVAKVKAESLVLEVRAFRPTTGDACFTAVLTPPDVDDDRLVPRDLTLVLDVSGSMDGAKLDQAKGSAKWLLDNLRPRDRVNVILFSDAVRRFAESPIEASPENLESLKAFVAGAAAQGGADIGGALDVACKAPAEAGRVAMVVFVTDGRPTVGVVEPAKIVGSARAAADRGLRVFTFGIGDDVDPILLDGIASAGGGAAEVIRTVGDVESRFRAFLLRTGSPAITDLALTIGGRPVDDLLPKPFPAVFRGEQVVLTGRFAGTGTQEFVLRGMQDGKEILVATTADLGSGTPIPVDPAGASPLLPGVKADATQGSVDARHLYARNRIAWLERAQRLRDGLADDAFYAAIDRGRYSTRDELVAAQIDISLESGVQCAYTAFIALLPEDRARLNPRDTAALEQAARRAGDQRSRVVGDAPPADGTGEVLSFDESVFEGFTGGTSMGVASGGHFGAASSPFAGRLGGGGGRPGLPTQQTELAVLDGLRWLLRHQNEDGSWTTRGCARQCVDGGRCVGSEDDRSETFDAGLTGLALLAFLGKGYSGESKQIIIDPVKAKKHRIGDVMRKGLTWLQDHQAKDGSFARASEHAMFNDAIATLALCEAYALTHKSQSLEAAAQQAVDHLAAAQLPSPIDPNQMWGWGRVSRKSIEDRRSTYASEAEFLKALSDADASVTAWVVMAMQAAEISGLRVPKECSRGAISFARRITASTGAGEDRGEGKIGAEPLEANDHYLGHATSLAAGVVTRIFLESDLSDEFLTDAADRLVADPPTVSDDKLSVDYSYWYHASLALNQIDCPDSPRRTQRHWSTWSGAMNTAVLALQDKTEHHCSYGGWMTPDRWSRHAGRIHSTAINVLTLEVYYRYENALGRAAHEKKERK